MIDLGTVRPGSTIRIPFSSFDKDDGSSITMTNFAAADILVYKDGSTTERASTSGFTATTDFDTKTGKHLITINLADNTTAGFWSAGSEYLVAIDAVTVDTVTVGGWVARFRIGYRDAVLDTTIATLASQVSFTLTSGPAEDNALKGCVVILHNAASAIQCAFGIALSYVGSTKTVTLLAAPTFTIAAGDNISVMLPHPLDVAAVPPRSATVTITIASPGVVSWTAHGLTAGQPVILTTTGALPTGLTAGTTYYVIAAGLTVNAFELAATVGGTAINTSGTQSGTHTAAAGAALNARQAIAVPVIALGVISGNSSGAVLTSPPAVGTPSASPTVSITRNTSTGDHTAAVVTPPT